MSPEKSKLLLGIALGAIAGVALGALLVSEKKEIKEGVEHVAARIKQEMDELGRKIRVELETKGADYLKRVETLANEMAQKAEEYKKAVEIDLAKHEKQS